MADADSQTHVFRVTSEEISAADVWVEQVGQRWGIAARTLFGARICVAEIAANVLEHGAPLAQPAQLDVTLRRRNTGLDIEITDSGRPFDPTSFPDHPDPETIEAAEVGGYGLRLVRSYATDMTYRHDGARNRLMLRLPEAVS